MRLGHLRWVMRIRRVFISISLSILLYSSVSWGMLIGSINGWPNRRSSLAFKHIPRFPPPPAILSVATSEAEQAFENNNEDRPSTLEAIINDAVGRSSHSMTVPSLPFRMEPSDDRHSNYERSPEMENELTELKWLNESMQAESNALEARLRSQLESKDRRLEELEASLMMAESAKSAAEAREKQLLEDLEELREIIGTLKDDNEGQMRRNGELEAECEQMNQILDGLNSKMQELEGENKGKIRKLEEDVESLEDLVESLESRLKSANESLKIAQDRISALTESSQQSAQTILHLERDLNSASLLIAFQRDRMMKVMSAEYSARFEERMRRWGMGRTWWSRGSRRRKEGESLGQRQRSNSPVSVPNVDGELDYNSWSSLRAKL